MCLLCDVFGCFVIGVIVVIINFDYGFVGIIVNSFLFVFLELLLVFWMLDKGLCWFCYFEQVEYYVIYVLSCEQVEICNGFVCNVYVFDELIYWLCENGVFLIENCFVWFECKWFVVYEGGDYLIVLGQVMQVEMCKGDVLIFFFGKLG